MNREDIIRMAREAGFSTQSFETQTLSDLPERLTRFAALVAAAEREACAKVSEDCGAIWVAKRIRARGQASTTQQQENQQ